MMKNTLSGAVKGTVCILVLTILMLALIGLGGCSPIQTVASHSAEGLDAGSSIKQSLVWENDRITYDGNGNPTQFVSPSFDVFTEGPIGGASFAPDGTMQVVSQSDLTVGKLTRIENDEGSTFIIENLTISPSITRSAQAEALAHYDAMFANLSLTQQEEIRERYQTFRSGITSVSDIATEAFSKLLVPVP